MNIRTGLLILVAASSCTAAGALMAPDAAAQTRPPGAAPRPELRTPKAGARPPPSALPGSHAEPTSVAPAEHVAADMPPTEALYDAINRGDLPGTRDAVARGAELNGTNVLGLTPLELSVDLGRNEITFLLLSLRGTGGPGAREATHVTAAPAGANVRPINVRPIMAERRQAPRREAHEAPAASPAAPRRAQLFAGGGGAPIPQAGFLGFDAGH